jgi:hypothetical protein
MGAAQSTSSTPPVAAQRQASDPGKCGGNLISFEAAYDFDPARLCEPCQN